MTDFKDKSIEEIEIYIYRNKLLKVVALFIFICLGICKIIFNFTNELYFISSTIILSYMLWIKSKTDLAEKVVAIRYYSVEDEIKELKVDEEHEKWIRLIEEIGKARLVLFNSLSNIDRRIQEYSRNAKLVGLSANCLIGLDIYIIIYFLLNYEQFIPLFEKLGTWSLMLLSFPVVMILTIAITLLRHHKKLLDEVLHYSAEKRQIELYSGLLKASQHAAAGLNDPQKSAEYVQETFTAIRNRILSEQPHSNTAASASEKEDYSVPEIVKGLVDLIAKNEAKK